MKITGNLMAVLCAAIIIGCFGVNCYIRFSNPELTETQLFLKYWKLCAFELVGFGVLYYFVKTK